jgi:Tol biopolymer transport system component
MRQRLHARLSPGKVVSLLIPLLALEALLAGCQEVDRPLGPSHDGAQFSNASASGLHGKIVFHSTRDGDFDVVVMNADGTDQTKLTSDEHNDIDPVWSPNGQRIAFNRFPADFSGCEVYLMNADGSGVTQLTHGGGYEFGGIWSPNGKQIAFVTNRDFSNDIYVINVDGSGVTRLTTGAYVGAVTAWSPNGKQIAFISNRDQYGQFGDNEIFVMNADGTEITQLTDNYFDDEGDRAGWSPNGKLFAFSSRRDGGDLDIFVMNADGTGVRQITGIGGDWVDDDDPTWSPNGKHLAFQSSRDGDEEVWTSTLDASEVTQLTYNVGAFDAVPSWVSGVIHLP